MAEQRDVDERRLLAALRLHVRTEAQKYLDDPNVTSVGIGRKPVGDGPLCVQFTVATKLAPERLGDAGTMMLPRTVRVAGVDVPTDVVERRFAATPDSPRPTSGTTQRHAVARSAGRTPTSGAAAGPRPGYDTVIPEAADNERRSRLDPVLPGVSVGHIASTAGTFGCVVYDTSGAEPADAPLMLSNWHVLHGDSGALGDVVVQPGPYDDPAVEKNHVGTLLRSHLGIEGDCAVARIEGRGVDAHVLGLGVEPTSSREARLGETVVKSGRTTGVTYGIVQRVEVVVELTYGAAGVQRIGGIEIGPDPQRPASGDEISMGGDSGSVWLFTSEGAPTSVMAGLHFGGEVSGSGPDHALACSPEAVLDVLQVSLTPGVGASAAPAAPAEAPVTEPERSGLTASRSGYDAAFLGTEVPAMALAERVAHDVTSADGSPVIPYTHFSLTLSARRRLAHWVAWNVDGGTLRKLSRDGMKFRFDPRVPDELQTGNEVYDRNRLDRGHLARRSDLLWGPAAEARRANSDSFYFTNISPQMDDFNQAVRNGVWGRLEDALFADVEVERLRISVMAGPVLADDDPEYRGVAVPRDFWKAIVYSTAGELRCRAFLFTQRINPEVLELDEFATYQVGLDERTDRTGVVFADTMHTASGAGRVEPEAVARRLDRIEDIVW